MQTDVDTLLERVRAYRRHRGWAINKMAKEAGVPWSVLQGMDDDGWSPSLKTLRALLTVIPDDFDPRCAFPTPPTDPQQGRAA